MKQIPEPPEPIKDLLHSTDVSNMITALHLLKGQYPKCSDKEIFLWAFEIIMEKEKKLRQEPYNPKCFAWENYRDKMIKFAHRFLFDVERCSDKTRKLAITTHLNGRIVIYKNNVIRYLNNIKI